MIKFNNLFIPAKNIINSNNNLDIIPKRIIQTYNTNLIHERIANNIKNILDKNPNYEYHLITDEIGIKLISKHFNNKVLNAFNKLKIGAAKGDFLRYISLYIYGGIYIDLDSSIIETLDNYLDYTLKNYIFYDNDNLIVNTPIITCAKNPLILNIINEVVKRIHNNETNIFLATGPYMMTDVIYNIFTNNSKYNTKDNINSKDREKVWINNTNYKKGKLLFVRSNLYKKCFQFKFPNYTNALLYPNNDKYKCTYNNPTPDLYKD